jgi:hypothetical protein
MAESARKIMMFINILRRKRHLSMSDFSMYSWNTDAFCALSGRRIL